MGCCERPPARSKSARYAVRHDLAVSIDDLDLQMRMEAAERADARPAIA
jgi:hypothetical protein